MEQHPIPQQISSYEFKLVGEMTLKQFIKAAVGIVLALLINSSGLIFFIKWPLMIISGAGGLALAFVPFQDRPLETWISAFIKSIYSPTIYTYKKKGKNEWIEESLKDKKKVSGEGKEGDEDLEKEEEEVPKKDGNKVKEFIGSLPSVKREESKTNEDEEREAELERVSKLMEEKEEVATEKEKTEEKKPETSLEEKETDWRDKGADLNLKTEKREATGEAVFGKIPMPDIPETPNLIVGMATTSEGKIIEGAIVEIEDVEGNPTRVLKTNQLGQFKSSTQLANGRYLIITEKEGYSFDRVNIDLKGEIVQPIKIIAKDNL